MKTTRFAKVVERSGKPEAYTLWVAPEQDAHFQAALKGHRVMTVHQSSVAGAKKDYGEVGFQKGAGAFLIFPKSLKTFEGSHVVGVKYDLLESAEKALSPAKKQRVAKQERPEHKPVAQQERPAKRAKAFPELRIVQREEVATPRAAPKVPATQPRDEPGRQLATLESAVKKALKTLEKGNAVAAYAILRKAIE